MSKLIAKIDRRLLCNSSYAIARSMGGSGIGYKYLTEAQAKQVERYDLTPIYLSQLEIETVNSKEFTSKLPCEVYYRDEDGDGVTTFDSVQEAQTWIQNMESKCSSGEKFIFVDLEIV